MFVRMSTRSTASLQGSSTRAWIRKFSRIPRPTQNGLDERARFEYIKTPSKPGSQPLYRAAAPSPGREHLASNCEWEANREEMVRDIRGSETKFTLDDHGFAIRNQSFPKLSTKIGQRKGLEDDYIASMTSLISDLLGETDMIIPLGCQVIALDLEITHHG